ncbi:hypothetical protein RUM43_004024 [Polyplax serrata]|uniref:Uncharacterized protein n=1 Tax=Polyplax serrata TaxID=468196 RepID=A0AAN8XP77_POLSC
MRIAILFFMCLIVVNAVQTRSKASTSKGRGGNSRIKRGTTELQKPKSGAGIRVSRKKRSAPAGEALSDVPESTHGKSQASTSKDRGGNSRVKRGAIRPAAIDRELQKPTSGAGIPVRRKKRSVPQDEPFSDVAMSDGPNAKKGKNGNTENKEKINIRYIESIRIPKGTNTDKPMINAVHTRSKASTSKGRGGNSRTRRAATRTSYVISDIQKLKSGDATGVGRKKRTARSFDGIMEVSKSTDGSNTKKGKNGRAENKEKPNTRSRRSLKIRKGKKRSTNDQFNPFDLINAVHTRSKASTSKGRGGNSRVKRAATDIQKPKSGNGIGGSRKKKSACDYDGIIEVSNSRDASNTKKGKNGKTEIKKNPNIRSVRSARIPKGTNTDKPTVNAVQTRSKARTSNGRGGNSRIKRGTTELQKPKSGAGIRVSRKKRSAPAGEALSDVPESTHGKSQASTSKDRGGNSRVKRGAIRPAAIDRELQKPTSGAGIPVRRKKRSVPQDEPFSDVAMSDGPNAKKGKNGETEPKGKLKPRIARSGVIKIRDTTN